MIITVYTLIFLILCFVMYIAFRAVNTGIKAKREIKEDKNFNEKKLNDNENLIEQIKRLSDLYESGSITKDEFEAAKKKILDE